MALMKQTATIEFTDGRVTGEIRLILADKIAYEATARARGWDAETDQVTTNVFLAWVAAKRVGEYAGSFEDFRDHDVVDLAISVGEPVDPTPKDHSPAQ